jgi:radical SAM/Cys-rich protein
MLPAGPSSHAEPAVHAFDARVRAATGDGLRALRIDTVQVNVGLRCNLACRHCHVESSPMRTEMMDEPTMRAVLDTSERVGARTLDLTGGAPEMHPQFRPFVDAALDRGLEVIVRTNLTIMLESGYQDLPGWLANRRVHLIASLPCYLPTNVDNQRGPTVHSRSVEVLRRLNHAGYGIDPSLRLDLVYNPLGPALPPSQTALEEAYRDALLREFGLRFGRLFTITNMPIGRFASDLERQGARQGYETMLEEAFNPSTLEHLMCRSQVNVGWDGALYDCDFNNALGLGANGRAAHVRDLDIDFARRFVRTGTHCFGCTAGGGSSCTGALV